MKLSSRTIPTIYRYQNWMCVRQNSGVKNYPTGGGRSCRWHFWTSFAIGNVASGMDGLHAFSTFATKRWQWQFWMRGYMMHLCQHFLIVRARVPILPRIFPQHLPRLVPTLVPMSASFACWKRLASGLLLLLLQVPLRHLPVGYEW